jgi:hypothetical protein
MKPAPLQSFRRHNALNPPLQGEVAPERGRWGIPVSGRDADLRGFFGKGDTPPSGFACHLPSKGRISVASPLSKHYNHMIM